MGRGSKEEEMKMNDFEQKLEVFLQNYEKELLSLTDSLREQPVPAPTEALFALYEQTGNRLKYEKVYFGRRRFLSFFAASSCFFKKAEDIEKLCQILTEVCAEECWALPAHVDRRKDPDWRIAVDLFAAETGGTLAEISYLLKEELPADLMKTIREEVFRRVLKPVLDSPVPYPRWEHNYSNWNAVCAGNVGAAAIYLMEDSEEKEALLKRLTDSLKAYYLKGFGNDGACMEGLGYWNYGFHYYCMFADLLKRVYGNDFGLLEGKKIENIAAFQQNCYFPFGRTISFSDGDRRGNWRIGQVSYLSSLYNHAGEEKIAFPDIAYAQTVEGDACFRWSGIYRDILWTREFLDAVKKGQTAAKTLADMKGQVTFRDAQWAIFRGGEEISAAFKGGTNDEPHNHNDIGSFFLLAGDDEILCDLGSGEYTKDYFSEKRYTIFCNATESHNTALIGMKGQEEGEDCRTSRFVTDGRGHVSTEFAAAYRCEALKEYSRDFSFQEKTGNVLVKDEFFLEKEIDIYENLVTQLDAFADGRCVVLTGKTYTAIIEAQNCDGPITLTKTEHRNHEGKKEEVTVIRWKVGGNIGHVDSGFQVMIAKL